MTNKNKRALKKYRIRNNSASYIKLLEVGPLLKREIPSSLANYFATLNSKLKQNTKEFWKFISSNRMYTAGVPFLIVGGSLVSDDNRNAITFNDYFRFVFADVTTCHYTYLDVAANLMVYIPEI
ncbi:unnamed protein product [Ixodes persulcatus]